MSNCKTPPKSIAPEDEKYWVFFCGILKHGRLTKSYQNHLLTNYMENFKKSVTHASVTNNTQNSLEYYEKLGDTVVNMCVNWWIHIAHPEVASIGFMDLILTSLKGTKYLGRMGIEKGWEKVVQINKKDLEDLNRYVREWNHDSIRDLGEYIKVYEDAVEAFFGCLVSTMLQDGKTFGAAVEVAYRIFFWMLETTHFHGPDKPAGVSVDYFDVANPIAQHRDLYQNEENGLKWNHEIAFFNGNQKAYTDDMGRLVPETWQWTVFHWDGIQRQPGQNYKDAFTKENRKILYQGPRSIDEGLSKMAAAQKALDLLAKGEYQSSSGKIGKLSRTYKIRAHLDPLNPEKEWKGFYYSHVQRKFGGPSAGGPPGRPYEPRQSGPRGRSPSPRGGRFQGPNRPLPGYEEDEEAPAPSWTSGQTTRSARDRLDRYT